MRLALLLLALAVPAVAQEALTAEEFEALVVGRTLTYGEAGMPPYGIEHYFPNRRVTWAWLESDECMEGVWYESDAFGDPAICFEYEDDLDPQCWRVFREGDGLRAEFLNDGDEGGQVLYEIVEEPGGLVCGGVGV